MESARKKTRPWAVDLYDVICGISYLLKSGCQWRMLLAVDTQGLPHAIHITTANITDRGGALEMFSLHKDTLSNVENVLVDGGHSEEPFANGVKKLLHCEVEIAKRNELHIFKVTPKRWVVERSFSWLEKCRRLWENCERKLNTSLHMVILAFFVLFVKRF